MIQFNKANKACLESKNLDKWRDGSESSAPRYVNIAQPHQHTGEFTVAKIETSRALYHLYVSNGDDLFPWLDRLWAPVMRGDREGEHPEKGKLLVNNNVQNPSSKSQTCLLEIP